MILISSVIWCVRYSLFVYKAGRESFVWKCEIIFLKLFDLTSSSYLLFLVRLLWNLWVIDHYRWRFGSRLFQLFSRWFPPNWAREMCHDLFMFFSSFSWLTKTTNNNKIAYDIQIKLPPRGLCPSLGCFSGACPIYPLEGGVVWKWGEAFEMVKGIKNIREMRKKEEMIGMRSKRDENILLYFCKI